jgi:hypothetical protein
MLRPDRESGAPNRYVSDNAAQGRRAIAGINLGQILHIVTRALSAIAEIMQTEEGHRDARSCWITGAPRWASIRKRYFARVVKTAAMPSGLARALAAPLPIG